MPTAELSDTAVSSVPVSALHPWKGQPRQHFDEVRYQELLASVKQHGVLQSLIARPRPAGGFEVVCGERRWRAAKEASLEAIPVSVRQLTDVEALVFALEENTKRNDLNPIEEAEAYDRLQKADPIYDDTGIAARFGKSVSYVRRRRRLVALEASVREAVIHGVLTPAHAELLAGVPAKLQLKAFIEAAFLRLMREQVPQLLKARDWDRLRDDVASVSSLREWIDREVRRPLDDLETQERLPELAPAIEAAAKTGTALLELSEDYQLSPADRKVVGPDVLGRDQYDEVGGRSYGPKTCPSAQRAVIVHGGPPRLLKVCIDAKCPVHHPAPVKQTTSGSSRPSTENSWAKKRRQWSLTKKAAMRAMVPALLKTALTPAIVKLVVGDYELKDIERHFGLTPSATNGAAMLLAQHVEGEAWDRVRFNKTAKAVGFDLAKFEREEAKRRKAAKKKPAAKATTKNAKKGGK